MVEDVEVLEAAIQAIEDLTDPVTGFLPSRAPMHQLPPPYSELSVACAELPLRYHGEDKDCRPWLDAKFGAINEEWMTALEEADRDLIDNLMTKVSLLCHAYRWQRMPTPPENYEIKSITLPPGLEALWSRLAERMDIPRVGTFYTMVCNNWRMEDVDPGSAYEVESIRGANIELIHSWLNPPIHEELRTFVSTALAIEAKGATVLRQIEKIYRSMIRGNSQEATYHLMVLEAGVLEINSVFNNAIKKSRIAPSHFLKFIQPTMIWMLDHGDGPLEGASGPQACTIQALDSFLGIPRNGDLGTAILESRKYMLPSHRQLLEIMDQASEEMRKFVSRAKAHRLLEAYNRCLRMMQSWRISHQKRGALYIHGDDQDPVENYVSTGLVVKEGGEQSDFFEKSMEGHIKSTAGRALDDHWKGRERSMDYLFRFLTGEQRERLLRESRSQTFAQGETIIQQGDLFPGLYSLKSGTATVRKTVGGEEKILATLHAHEIFGEMSLIENLPASASIIAEEELDVLHITLETVYGLISDHHAVEGGFYLALAQILSHRLRNAFG